MPFVYKQFTEADQPKYDSCKIQNYLRTFTYPRDWAVDEERDAWFVSFGGRGSQPESHGEPPNFFVLVWKSQPIYFEGRYTSVFPTREKMQAFYKLDIVIPIILKADEILIKNMVYEAMRDYFYQANFVYEIMPINFLNTFFVAG